MVSKTQTYRISPPIVWSAAEAALRSLGWTVRSADAQSGGFVATTPFSLRSWSNKVTIRIYVRPDGLTAVTAESNARAQLYTWGKTEEDVDHLFAGLDRSLLEAQSTR